MSLGPSWLESTIIRSNLRALSIATEKNSIHLSNSDSGSPDNFSTLQDTNNTSITPGFCSAYSTEGCNYFNPFDSPPPALSELLPPLPRSINNSPSLHHIQDVQQQLLDILVANLPAEPIRSIPASQRALSSAITNYQGMSRWNDIPSTEHPNPKAYALPLPENRPICQAYLAGNCQTGANCVYKHSLPMAYDKSAGRPESDRGTMSSSSGTPSDAHRSPAMSKSASNQNDDGWSRPREGTSSNTSHTYGNPTSFAGPSSNSYGTMHHPSAPLDKPNTEYSWNAGPSQQSYSNNYSRNGRPLSPDGWPAKKTEVRGHTEEVPDLLSSFLEQQQPKMVTGSSSGWKSTSSNVSRSTITAVKETPLPVSEINAIEASRPAPPPSPPPPALTAVSPSTEAVPNTQGWRTSTPKSPTPVLITPIAPVPVVPAHPPVATQAAEQPAASTSHVGVTSASSERPPSRTVRIVSGWTVKVPFEPDAEAVTIPPVPAVPQQYSSPISQPVLTSPTSRNPVSSSSAAADAGGEAWVLPNADAIRTNNWISTTRRSRVSREEQTPAYIPASSFGYEEENTIARNEPSSSYNDAASRSGYDDNSIRPSESASNVGVPDETTFSKRHASTDFVKPRYKPMREFQGEKDSEIGSSTSSSGSLDDNPNTRAGGWQRSPVPPANHLDKQIPLNTASSSSWQNQAVQQPQHPQHPQSVRDRREDELSAPGQQDYWQQQPSSSVHRESGHTPITAPMPRRWDSSSQQLVGDLERAATPRGASAVTDKTHGRSASSVTGFKVGSMSIRGASKYHAESLMLREELDKIRAQVAKYETVLSSMDAAEESNDADLEREVVELRQENLNLRNRVEQLEIERDEMRSALQPVLCMLGISSSSGKRTHRNGGGSNADHLGGYINGSGSASLQNLTMNSNRAASKQDQNQTRQVGW